MKNYLLWPCVWVILSGACTSPDNGGPGTGGTSKGSGGSNGGAVGPSGFGGAAGSSGGAPGVAGTTGAAGGTGGAIGGAGGAASGTPDVCQFASGLNVAWVNFANDIPSPNLTAFNTLFQNTAAAGGRVVRWWFHTNGTVTPGYDSSGMAKPLSQGATNDLISLLNAAHSAGVALNISLWSFDMLQGSGSGEGIPAATLTNNKNLLTVDANRQAYIDNVLTPMVNAIKGNPGLYSYEIFNEAEGMTTEHGWTSQSPDNGLSVPEAMIQKTVNWFAAAIHTADPAARVTTGAQTFDYCSTASGKSNLYSDATLRAAGGKQNGTLDFYEVHYYTQNGTSDSPFMYPASHWGLDKKLVMGEFYAETTGSVSGNDLYTYLYTNGYNGAWAWQYDDSGNTPNGDPIAWPSMKMAIMNLYTAQTSVVGSCP